MRATIGSFPENNIGTLKNVWAYDLESYPNFFSGVFVPLNYQTDDDIVRFVCHNKDVLGRVRLKAFLIGQLSKPNGLTLVGFNNSGYDDLLLNEIMNNPYASIRHLYELTVKIIEGRDTVYPSVEQLKRQKTMWNSIDLMTIATRNDIFPSLKGSSVHLQWWKLESLPIAPGTIISADQIPKMMDYNDNDGLITREMFLAIVDDIVMRDDMGRALHADRPLLSLSDSALGDEILRHHFGYKPVPAPQEYYIDGANLIPSRLKFSTKEMLTLAEKMAAVKMYAPFRFKHEFTFYGTKYSVGVGGLHTEDDPRILTSTEEYTYIDADVTSYYPFIIINEELHPRTIDKFEFLHTFRNIVDMRVVAKGAGDKVKAYGLKIAINAVSGKMNFMYSWLYDPLAYHKITAAGQLYLLDLIEKLELNGIHVVSANTDGVVAKVYKKDMALYKRICEEWQTRTRFTLEYTYYAKLAQEHVNSYLALIFAVEEGGVYYEYDKPKVKGKGTNFVPAGMDLTKTSFTTGYDRPIISHALRSYILQGIKPEDYIPTHQNVYDFCATKKSKTFDFYLHTDPVNDVRIKLQNNVRVIMVKGGEDAGYFLKFRRPDDPNYTTVPHNEFKNQIVKAVNNIDDNLPISEYNIDYAYYVAETYKIIDKLEQLVTPKKFNWM